jgi:DNA-binding transcriptional ArsR family regulator
MAAKKNTGTIPAASRSRSARQPLCRPVQDLERLIHERTRLGIVSSLAAATGISFQDLKAMLGVSDGNLSSHARKLEDAGYISCLKRFEGRKPLTTYTLTAKGQKAFHRYLAHMEALIDATRNMK